MAARLTLPDFKMNTTTDLQLCRFKTLDSTNAEAKRQLQAGQVVSPTLFWAETQTAGRGTQGRVWHSPAGGGVYFSLAVPQGLIPQAIQHAPPGELTQTLGHALAASLVAHYSLPVTVKPINDLYAPLPNAIGNLSGSSSTMGKLGGILVESLLQGPVWQGLVVGVGLNWWHPPAESLTPPAVAACQLNPSLQEQDAKVVVGQLGQVVWCHITTFKQ